MAWYNTTIMEPIARNIAEVLKSIQKFHFQIATLHICVLSCGAVTTDYNDTIHDDDDNHDNNNDNDNRKSDSKSKTSILTVSLIACFVMIALCLILGLVTMRYSCKRRMLIASCQLHMSA